MKITLKNCARKLLTISTKFIRNLFISTKFIRIDRINSEVLVKYPEKALQLLLSYVWYIQFIFHFKYLKKLECHLYETWTLWSQKLTKKVSSYILKKKL